MPLSVENIFRGYDDRVLITLRKEPTPVVTVETVDGTPLKAEVHGWMTGLNKSKELRVRILYEEDGRSSIQELSKYFIHAPNCIVAVEIIRELRRCFISDLGQFPLLEPFYVLGPQAPNLVAPQGYINPADTRVSPPMTGPSHVGLIFEPGDPNAPGPEYFDLWEKKNEEEDREGS